MAAEKKSKTSLEEATRGRAEFSEHGSLAAAGFHSDVDAEMNNDDILIDASGESVFIDRPEEGFPKMTVSLSWERIKVEKKPEGLFQKLFSKGPKTVEEAVDLDLGCLYELKNGERGCLQAFGELYGAYEQAPFIHHGGDERTGDSDGADEYMEINGAQWDEIKRILVYIYIYQGAPNWRTVKPEITIDVPGENDLKMIPHVKKGELVLCAVGTIENIDGGLSLRNHSEYFRGHAEMDRAFGFGLEWEDGEKR